LSQINLQLHFFSKLDWFEKWLILFITVY
jgi:hypothetical protein